MKPLAWILGLLVLLFASRAEAALCEGCVATAPKGDEKVPLIVILHGDWGGGPKLMHDTWLRFTKPRNVALLALQCPKDDGCKGSWWKWNGDPKWIERQIDAFADDHPIDRERLWIAGWSGGATYIGMHTQEIEATFAGIVIHGGGYWPLKEGCAATPSGVFFLYGDHNPLHAHAVELHDHYEKCGNELSTTLLKGADHEGEWKALDSNGGKILDWLANKKRVKPAPVIATPTPPPAATLPPPTASFTPPPAAKLPPPARSGCGCSVPAPSSDRAPLLLLVIAAAIVTIRSRSASAHGR